MLYQVLTLKVGDKQSNEEASKILSREAKKGFIVQQVTTCLDASGSVINTFLLERVPIQHLESLPNDPKGLRRIQLGDRVFYWDPCGGENDGTD